jgi:hypothetical protein
VTVAGLGTERSSIDLDLSRPPCSPSEGIAIAIHSTHRRVALNAFFVAGVALLLPLR